MEWLIIIGIYILFRVIVSASSGPKIGPFEIRAVEDTFDIEGKQHDGIKIEAKGLLNLPHATDVSFITTIMDVTDGEEHPVISGLDSFQEPGSMAYQFRSPAGIIEPNMGFLDWLQVAVVFPEILDCPRKGRRALRIKTFIVDNNIPINFVAGYLMDTNGVYNVGKTETVIEQIEFGYEEAKENELKAIPLIIKLAMFVGFSDGSLDDAEGEVIKGWVVKVLERYKGDQKAQNKETFNAAIKEAFSEAKKGTLIGLDIARKLNDISDKFLKYQAIELCMDVMAADGVADENELKTIRKISEVLGLDYDEIESMNDKRMLTLEVTPDASSSLENILGIDPNWPKEKIKAQLNKQFTKWNGRMQALDEGRERERAQEMLNLIGEARQKYK